MKSLADVFFLICYRLDEINRNCRAAGTLRKPHLLGEYQPERA